MIRTEELPSIFTAPSPYSQQDALVGLINHINSQLKNDAGIFNKEITQAVRRGSEFTLIIPVDPELSTKALAVLMDELGRSGWIGSHYHRPSQKELMVYMRITEKEGQ